MSEVITYNVINYTDLNYRGFQGTEALVVRPFQVKSHQAIVNVIKMYLMSYKGDYGRNISKGGILIDAIGKQMDDNSESKLRSAIKEAMSLYSNIIVGDIKIIRNYESRGWEINISFSDTYNKFEDTINLGISQ